MRGHGGVSRSGGVEQAAQQMRGADAKTVADGRGDRADHGGLGQDHSHHAVRGGADRPQQGVFPDAGRAEHGEGVGHQEGGDEQGDPGEAEQQCGELVRVPVGGGTGLQIRAGDRPQSGRQQLLCMLGELGIRCALGGGQCDRRVALRPGGEVPLRGGGVECGERATGVHPAVMGGEDAGQPCVTGRAGHDDAHPGADPVPGPLGRSAGRRRSRWRHAGHGPRRADSGRPCRRRRARS